ncbi:fatty acid desaturase family protein [Actinokineospora sp.]|uniref:fatty acid desaturase family protein n=1 Tax=Actinokineospora sp. TaxID=1872133 RepID=UPI003D6BE321
MPAQPGSLTLSPTGTFEELSRLAKEAGLTAPRPGYYIAKTIAGFAMLAGCEVAFFLIGDSWWQLLTAVALAIALVQTGFMAHDVGHKQVTTSKRRSEILGMLHMNVLLGVSYGWWVNHHNRHHNNPNNLDKDPDTIRRPVIFDVDELPAKSATAFGRFVIRFQAVMFFVLLGHESVRLHMSGFRAAKAGILRSARLELGLVFLHAAIYLTVVFWVLSPVTAVVFILVNKVVFGIYLGMVFAPNHKGMVVYRDDVELDWLHRQVLTSRNIRSSRFVDFVYGGLNYQVEHHLFPSMPRVNLRRVRPLVMDYCQRHSIPYVEVSVWQSYAEVTRFLAKVSDEARH